MTIAPEYSGAMMCKLSFKSVLIRFLLWSQSLTTVAPEYSGATRQIEWVM
jgi:hypothetical protein